MGAPLEDAYRLRLEGKAELLEATLLRYRTLVHALKARRWEAALHLYRRLVRACLEEQPRVDAALDSALRRARAEDWPRRGPMRRALEELESLRSEWMRWAARRLGVEAEPGALLAELEERALTVPREVPPGERWATAVDVLPERLEWVREAGAFGASLQALFNRPLDAERALPWSLEEREALRGGWARGEAALEAAWARLARVDATGGLAEELRRRAEREPGGPPGSGPEKLVHARYWREVAWVRLEALVRARLSPLVVGEEERLEVVWWLCEREGDEGVRLGASEGLREGRAGLVELAYELWEAREEAPAGWKPGRWERLEALARQALLEEGEDVARLRRLLREWVQRHGMGSPGLRGWREEPRLDGLVRQARAMLG